MLPFLKKKNESTGLIATAQIKDGEIKMDGEMSELEIVMDELIQAVQSGDAKGAAQAFEAAFKVCELYPHEEVEHES